MDVLRRAADARRADPRLEQRLADVQELLGEDLARLERALRETAQDGTPPAGEAALHLLERGGKRVRPLALLLSAACFGPVPDAARELAVVVELIHSATLLHDDVIDEGGERRGAPAARRLWGNGISVLAGDLLLVTSLERTHEHAPAELPGLLATLRRLVDGEIVQLRGRLELDPSPETYDRILRDKTASLFAWATAVGARLAGAPEARVRALESFGEELGVAFQLVDDVLDYAGEASEKSLLTDLTEGKLTLPLVLTVKQRPEILPLLQRVQAGDRSVLDQVGQAVRESGACDEVRARARSHTDRALAALDPLPTSPAKRLLEAVALELAARAR